MKGKGKAPTKVAAASTAATKKNPSTKPPPTTMPMQRTAGRKYTNWIQNPSKYALACTVEEKLKVIDTQLSEGGFIIPDETLRYLT